MRAVKVPVPGGVEALEVVDVPVPEPGEGEVLVRVAAAGVNRADLLQRQGFYDPPPGATDVLGLECSGTVVGHGPGVPTDALPVGTEVVALLGGGAYAEHVAVPAGQLAPLPDGVGLVDAAGLMEVAATVWSNVFMLARLRPEETLLLHGGGSGIGTFAIQLAKAFGARVAVTAGSERKLEACRALGADVLVNYREQDFVEELRTLGVAPDVILDVVGAKYLERNVAALATNGRLVVIGMQGGVKAELNLATLLGKRAAVMATSLRARPADEKAAIVAAVVEHVWPLVASGEVKPVIDRTYPLDDVRAAHQALEDGDAVGKVLLTL